MTDTKNAANDFNTLVSKSMALHAEMVSLNNDLEILATKEQTKGVVSEKTYLQSIMKGNLYIAGLYADLLVYFAKHNPTIHNPLKNKEGWLEETSVADTEGFLKLINDVKLVR